MINEDSDLLGLREEEELLAVQTIAAAGTGDKGYISHFGICTVDFSALRTLLGILLAATLQPR